MELLDVSFKLCPRATENPWEKQKLRSTDSDLNNIPSKGNNGDNDDETKRHLATYFDDEISHEIASSSLKEIPTYKRKKPNVERALIDFMENYKVKRTIIEDVDDMAFFIL